MGAGGWTDCSICTTNYILLVVACDLRVQSVGQWSVSGQSATILTTTNASPCSQPQAATHTHTHSCIYQPATHTRYWTWQPVRVRVNRQIIDNNYRHHPQAATGPTAQQLHCYYYLLRRRRHSRGNGRPQDHPLVLTYRHGQKPGLRSSSISHWACHATNQ